MRFVWMIGAMLLFLCLQLPAQQAPTLDSGYRDMYNLEFASAHRVFEQYERQHPEDPLGPASNAAAFLFQEFDRLRVLQSELFIEDANFENRPRLQPDPQTRTAFESELARSHQIADSVLKYDPRDANALFAEVLELGLRSDYVALIDKRDMAGLKYMKAGRLLAEKLLAVQPDCYDAYVAIGVENYMLSLKPAPMRWLLRITGAQTDKESGVRDLTITAEKGHYLLPFARLLLAVVALRNSDQEHARFLLSDLARQFPANHLYSEELAKLH